MSDDMATPPDTRRLAVQRQAELLHASQRRESEKAQQLIDAFIVQAGLAGLAPVRLVGRASGGRPVKTDLQGWYIRADHTVAIGTDGGYYLLTALDAPLLPWRGVTPSPLDPPLVVGRGGKDGESGDLKDFLDRALSGQVD